MSVRWTAYPFKRALATAVAARSGITSLTSPTVKVITYFPSPDDPMADSIIVGYDLRDTKEMVTVGGKTHDENVEVVSQIRVVRPGGGQSVADAAEDRARLILAEIDDELRENPVTVTGAQIINPRVADRESLLFSVNTQDSTAGKMCVIEFTIRYRGKTST